MQICLFVFSLSQAGSMAVQPAVFPDGWETLGTIQDYFLLLLLLLLCSKTATQTVSPF